ncbi:MAG TPA: gamma-glutamyltransferase family protein, partial [Candidatus Limnocylindria bacterium]|nr:gamma-glutamyltransferase family protein [Candidatus Limnocylindria bacterium]
YLASEAGLGVLRAGGSAVDAAIATNAALAVVAAHSCGLGGDAFWLIWNGVRVQGLNGSGRSARGATLEAAAAAGLSEMPLRGPWTVTVPGAIHSWGEAHARYGQLHWATLLEPAAELADGFPATDGWVGAVERSAAIFGTDGDWARTFRPHGRAWQVGEVVRLPNLAATLRRLAQEGPAAAYSGGLAGRAAEYLAGRGSPLRADDFAAHRSDWTEPVAITYRGVTSLSHPPNSSGLAALELLGVLERFPPPPPGAYGPAGVADARWVHLGLEAARQALANRDRLLTDPAHMSHDVLASYLDNARIAALAAGIDQERAAALSPPGMPAGGGTVFLTTADAEGRLVSLIESNYAGFGSGLVDPETGVGYQNRGAFFRLDPRHANALAPGKRTMHTLTPGMLLRDGSPWIAHGQKGGEIQPQIFAQFVSAVVDGQMDIAGALAAPRCAALMPGHMQPPSITALESRYRNDVVDDLRRRGHDVQLVEPFSPAMGHAQAVEVVPDGSGGKTLAAASDPRSEGAALAW